MSAPTPFTHEWALAHYLIARQKALHSKYNVSMHQLGLEEDEVKWLIQYCKDQGWIVSTSTHITHEHYSLWKLPEHWRSYAPGERRDMLDEELELYLGVARLVMERNGRILVNKFAEYTSIEGLWRLVASGDAELKYRVSNSAYHFTLDKCYRT